MPAFLAAIQGSASQLPSSPHLRLWPRTVFSTAPKRSDNFWNIHRIYRARSETILVQPASYNAATKWSIWGWSCRRFSCLSTPSSKLFQTITKCVSEIVSKFQNSSESFEPAPIVVQTRFNVSCKHPTRFMQLPHCLSNSSKVSSNILTARWHNPLRSFYLNMKLDTTLNACPYSSLAACSCKASLYWCQKAFRKVTRHVRGDEWRCNKTIAQ